MRAQGKVIYLYLYFPVFPEAVDNIRMFITYNGSELEIEAEVSLQEYLHKQGLSEQSGIAVALNETVIPKKEWENCILKPYDSVLVIKATQGG